MQHALKL
ncbi:hypothetical protein E2C01_069703 [Portunus trituberculatus]|nr:hypothetical protein [Portunus trituberculatus]